MRKGPDTLLWEATPMTNPLGVPNTTQEIRQKFGWNTAVDSSSGSYVVGQVTGVATLCAIGVAAIPELATAGAGALGARGAYSQGTRRQVEQQLAEHGRKALMKSRASYLKNIRAHEQTMGQYRQQGGRVTSMEREVRTWRSQVKAIDDVLGD